MSKPHKGILDRLAKGPVIGDGSMIFTLEKRGYVKVGPWTPEAVIEYRDAVRNLHREYLRAGCDVIQTATFYANDNGKLSFVVGNGKKQSTFTSVELNDAACKLACEVAAEGNALVCGSISPISAFSASRQRHEVEAEYMKQIKVFQKNKFFNDIEEVEIAVSMMKSLNIPVGICMRIGPIGAANGVPVEECALRMARTGADMIGVNCMFDPNTCLETMARMKKALEAQKLTPYLICQPFGYHCPEVKRSLDGYVCLPETPMCLEPRQLTRIDAHKFARAAWKLGIRYIGGCCGMESHHIRAISQELLVERGNPEIPCLDYCEPFGGQRLRDCGYVYKHRSTREYWYDVKPGCGRPFNPPLSTPEEYGVEKVVEVDI